MAMSATGTAMVRKLVSSLLTGGKNARLYKRLVYDLQIAQDVNAFEQSQALGSVFVVIATARPGQTLENPVPPGQQHHLPGIVSGQEMYWQVTSAGGREHLLVFVVGAPRGAK